MATRMGWVLAVVGMLVLGGCGGKKADENKPLADVQAEAGKMSAGDLRDMAVAYKDAIMAKQEEVKKLADKLKGMSINEMMGEGAKKLKADSEKLETSVSALKERFDVYYQELKKKNGDVSGLDLSK
jgi:hypothetical protein